MKYKKRLRRVGIACAAAVLLGISCNVSLKSVYYDIDTEEDGAPVKIAFLSDVHNSFYGKGQAELVQKIKEFDTDIVLFGGDLFDEHNGEENSWALVDALVGEYPCFYAIGNHEFNTGKPKFYKSEMEKRGVTVLDDETTVITVNDRRIRICGIENVRDENAAAELDDTYSVLLYHYPLDFPEMSEKGFDLILSGHAHGGQWRIPGLINGVFAPDEGFFPQYAGGFYSRNGTDMIVSRGLYRNISCLFIPRIFNRPELVFITLK